VTSSRGGEFFAFAGKHSVVIPALGAGIHALGLAGKMPRQTETDVAG
jgi:hypothetical protein